MITFLLSIVLLIAGYFVYGKFVEKVFGADDNIKTPAIRLEDGVDFVPMPGWKIFLIQFLNIAGLGPIFGAVAGALWGPVAFLWIVFGCIFAGGVHDYFSGMLSIRHNGTSVSEIVGHYLGNGFKQFMRVFSVVLLVLTGVVFVTGPAGILADLFGTKNVTIFVYIIFAYYLLATIVPVDKLIGKIYPIFGFALFVMAAGVASAMVINGTPIPELTLANLHPEPSKYPTYPLIFITIACGAISGFHATQSPLMARCCTSESQGRKIFYGSMIAEGVVALVWAAAAMSFFGGINQLSAALAAHGNNAAWVVNTVCNTWLGKVGGILAILGVVACPITSGDTAFRSARLNIADMLNFKQGSIKNRFIITIPLFAVGFVLTQVPFDIVWRYFGWANQTLATILLWASAMFLAKNNKNFWIAAIPAAFMTSVCVSYILMDKIGFGLPQTISNTAALISLVASLSLFIYASKNLQRLKQK